MDFAAELASVKAAIKASGEPIDDVLRRADVDRSTWTRWNNGTIKGPNLQTWWRLKVVVDNLKVKGAA